MTTIAWPFETDADRDDPLTALRIPVVGSFRPRWKYVAAYLKPASKTEDTYSWCSAERPTDTEAAMLASFIREYITHYFHEGYQARLAERALDVDSGCVTTVFIKYGEGDWGYRKDTWQYGPTFVPEPPHMRERYPNEKPVGPLTLGQVMDRIHHMDTDYPSKRWAEWKASHADVFGEVIQ